MRSELASNRRSPQSILPNMPTFTFRRVFTLLILAFLLPALPVFAQAKTVTVFVFRHADREEAVEGDDTDPDISIDGQRRAIRLALMLRKYRIDRVFSTNYARTLQTVRPLSQMRNVVVELYEPSEMDALARTILESTTRRRIAVVGHNSTAFTFVNKLLKADRYKMPADMEYGNLWILKIRKGKIREKMILY